MGYVSRSMPLRRGRTHRTYPNYVAESLLIILAVSALSSSRDAYGFSSNQSAVISIGQSRSPSYGILNSQGGLAFDSSGRLWVADTYNNRVLGFAAPFSNDMPASFVLGQKDFKGTEPGIGADRFHFSNDVAFERNGNLWVADLANNRVLGFAPPFHNGMNASLVVGQPDFSSTWSNTSQNRLVAPYGISFDASDNLWIADAGNSRVLEFQPPFRTGMNASLVIGEPDFTHEYCNASSKQYNDTCGSRRILNAPSEVAFDPSGDLWVGEGIGPTGRLLEFKPPFRNGMEATLLIGPVYPSALIFDSAGNLWLGCLWRGVFEHRPPFNERSIATVDGVPKNWSLTLGTYPGERADLPLSPTGFAFDSAGNLWVVDFRATWMLGNVVGRVLGFDAHLHQLHTPTGPVYFDNQGGLLAPLSSIPVTQVGPLTLPEGLFNFTIQGLAVGDSVTVTITFPHALPTGVRWWERHESRWSPLPANQTYINGNNMTLTLTGATPNGVVSVFGGPAVAPVNITAYTVNTAISTSELQNPSVAVLAFAGVVAVIVTFALTVIYWRHWRKPNGLSFLEQLFCT